MAKEYIEREVLIDRIKQEPTDGMFTDEILDAIAEIPAANVAPVVHGLWDYYPTSLIINAHYRCSNCASVRLEHYAANDFRCCPNCGAKMDLL